MAGRVDEALPLLGAELPGFDAPLRQTWDAAAYAPLTAAGSCAAVVTGGAACAHRVWIHPLRVAEGVALEGAEARDVVVTPLGVERRLGLGDAEVLERVFVPRDVPAVVFEWRAPTGASLSIAWRAGLDRTVLTSSGGSPAPGWSSEGRALRLRADGSNDAAAFVLSREPEAWEVEAEEGGGPALRVRSRLRLAPGESVRLAVAATTEGEAALAATLAALRPEALVHARAAAMRRMERERLALNAPDERAGLALEWAKHHLDALRAEAPGVGRSIVAGFGVESGEAGAEGTAEGAARGALAFETREAVPAALAALAVGAFDAARDVLRLLGDHRDDAGRAPSLVTLAGEAHYDAPDATALYLILTARYLAWTGDIGFVRDAWARVRRASEHVRAAGLGSIALAELAVAAESVGDGALAEALRAHPVRPGAPILPSFVGASGAAWAEFASGRTEAATREWLRSVEALLEGGHVSATESAAVVNGLVYGLLGAEPDGVKGRLRLRPQLPVSWDRLDARRILMGDVAVTLGYTRHGDRHVFRLEQEEGSVPVTVIFEPMLPARRLVAARVDGVDAELDPRPLGERMLVPVQLVLDAERVVELDVAHDAAPSTGLRVWRT